MKRLSIALIASAIFLAPLAAVAEGSGLEAGLGLGVDGILPVTGDYGLLGLVMDLRAGGYVGYSPFAVGNAALGLEIGAWAFALPLGERPLVMAEIPAYLTARFPIGDRSSFTAQAGYCLMLGVGEDVELTHCAALGARFLFGRHFAEAGAFAPLASSEGGAVSFALLPHAAFGWRL